MRAPSHSCAAWNRSWLSRTLAQLVADGGQLAAQAAGDRGPAPLGRRPSADLSLRAGRRLLGLARRRQRDVQREDRPRPGHDLRRTSSCSCSRRWTTRARLRSRALAGGDRPTEHQLSAPRRWSARPGAAAPPGLASRACSVLAGGVLGRSRPSACGSAAASLPPSSDTFCRQRSATSDVATACRLVGQFGAPRARPAAPAAGPSAPARRRAAACRHRLRPSRGRCARAPPAAPVSAATSSLVACASASSGRSSASTWRLPGRRARAPDPPRARPRAGQQRPGLGLDPVHRDLERDRCRSRAPTAPPAAATTPRARAQPARGHQRRRALQPALDRVRRQQQPHVHRRRRVLVQPVDQQPVGQHDPLRGPPRRRERAERLGLGRRRGLVEHLDLGGRACDNLPRRPGQIASAAIAPRLIDRPPDT
jgi:hypothetical protein